MPMQSTSNVTASSASVNNLVRDELMASMCGEDAITELEVTEESGGTVLFGNGPNEVIKDEGFVKAAEDNEEAYGNGGERVEVVELNMNINFTDKRVGVVRENKKYPRKVLKGYDIRSSWSSSIRIPLILLILLL